jgi:hypothetical protein
MSSASLIMAASESTSLAATRQHVTNDVAPTCGPYEHERQVAAI